MADPLSMLRNQNIWKRDIHEYNDRIVLGDVSWPKDVKTNFLTWRASFDGGPKEYYTLESVLFLLKNAKLFREDYAKKAAARSISVIEDVMRTDLLAYLNGEVDFSKYIDYTKSFDVPAQRISEVNNTILMGKKGLYAEMELSACIPHFGETLVNDIKEENNETSQFRETQSHDEKENYFELHYGETIVNDCKEEVDLFRSTANKRGLQQCCSIKREHDVTCYVPEKKTRVGETFCDVKEECENVVWVLD